MRTPRLSALTLLLVAAITLALACDDQPGTPGTPGAPGNPVPQLRNPNLETTHSRALDAARALWTARGATNYDLRLSWLCFCGPNFPAQRTLEVRNNAVTSGAIPGETGTLADHQTVERLFTLIEDAINQRAAAINITYHSTLGYPLQAYIDYDLKIADEELGFTIHQLTLR